jgi:hypothetical protein
LDRWYKDEKLLRAAYEEYGSLEAAANAIGGVTASTLHKTWRSNPSLPPLPRGPAPRGQADQEALRRLAAKVYS